MKILFIANRFPYPPYRGDKLKIYNLCRRLSESHELHLITFTEKRSELRFLPEVKAIFKSVTTHHLPGWKKLLNTGLGLFDSVPLQVAFFRSAGFRKKLKNLLSLHEFDAIHVQHLRMAQYAMHLKDQYRILDLPDAFSLYWERRKDVKRNVFSRILDHIESERVKRYENKVLELFDMNLVCSTEDLDYLKKAHENAGLSLLPNGVDTETFKPVNHDYRENKLILFTGNMDYDPNIDAVIYFVREIYPKVLESFPLSIFVIAGQRPVDKVKKLDNGGNIRVTGFVPKISEMYNEAAIVVAPLRFGAGTQNKVLEAMAMGIPVVCSHIGFAGLSIKDGEGAFMRTDAASFSDMVIDLLGSESLRSETGLKGIEIIKKSFTWDIIAGRLEEYLRHRKPQDQHP